jgi:1,2-phenylacetyl-CoA epoxidase catalytic subunit
VSIVQIKSRHLVGRYGIVEEDLADLRQQWIAAIIRTADYQKRDVPCFSTYVGRLVDH